MAVDRKQQMKEITERLEQGVKDIFTSEMYTTYLRTMAKFHNYSFNNTLLIAMQRPDATLVAGFNAWKNKFNRYVKKGEKGIQIIAPAPIKEVEEREKIDKDTGLTVLNENGEPEMERVEYVVPRFRVTTVFDVSQTDGEPIPSLEVNELTASVKDYALLTAAIEQVSPVPMRFDEIEGDAKGYYSDADKEICIQVGMGESQTIKTMIHEVAHAMLHNSDLMKQRGEEKDRLTKETEAESIAFTVCSALGIDTSDYSFPYVASWASGKEMKELNSELNYVDTYFDNGFTGTNFKRPAFTRLMNDVRQKKIKCIVVKDLSRFGRNYLEAGYYIETVFPFLGVRLIAVTDNFDSTRKEDMESLALPIRNMVNTMYAKDISKKVWTSLQRKKEAGYAVGSDAPFGYIRNPVTKRNEIDPETAFYVQLIFQWVLMGVAIFEIARRLTLLKVPTPREWHRKIVEGKEVVTYKKWGETSVRHMLANQTYVGDTINNKSTQRFFAGQDKRDLSKEQWYVAKNTHPAIIARDDFEKVQEILTKNQKVFKTVRAESEQIRTEYQNDLAGMVFCADCGRSMDFDRLPHGAEESKKVCYYICRARQADDKCIGHQITEKLLKALVMDQLHLFIVRLSDKRKILEELRKIEDMQNPVYRAKSEIVSLTDKVGQMAKKREQLYADYVAGVVDSEDYQLIREDYSKQYDGLRAALQRAEAKKVEVEQQIREYLNMTSNLEEHLDDFGFDAQLVKSLVQRIEVSADKRIRIVFGFQDVFADLGKESAGK